MMSWNRPPSGRARGPLVLALALLSLLAWLPTAALAAPSSKALVGVVNVNTASAEELQLLPGIGEARARAIVSSRRESGGFKSFDELTRVRGISAQMLERMRAHITLSGKTTARRAASDEADNAGNAKNAAKSGGSR